MGKYTPLTPELKKIPYVRRPLDPTIDPKERKRIRDRERRAWVKMIRKQNQSISPKKHDQLSTLSGTPQVKSVKSKNIDFLIEDVDGGQTSNMKLDPSKYEAFVSRKKSCLKEESRSTLYQLMNHFLHLFMKKDKNKSFLFHTNDSYHPSFSKVVAKHMDLFTLKKNLQAQKYDSLGGFVKDFELMCENSINYNLPGSSHSKLGKSLLEFGRKTYSKNNLQNIQSNWPDIEKILPKDLELDQVVESDPEASIEKIVARAKEAAQGAGNKLLVYKPQERDRCIRQQTDGTTSLSIFPPSQVSLERAAKSGNLATLGKIVGRVSNSSGNLRYFIEDARNTCTPIKSLNYGAFSAHLPNYDSTFSNVTEKDMKLISSFYDSSESKDYLKEAMLVDYDALLGDRLIGILTEKDHQERSNYLAEEKLVNQPQLDSNLLTLPGAPCEIARVEETEQSQDSQLQPPLPPEIKDIDFDALKSLSQDGIDMSFLDEMQTKISQDLSEEAFNIQDKLDETSALLDALQQCQNDRLRSIVPCLLSQLSSHHPGDVEGNYAEEIKQNLKRLASETKPEDIVPQETVRRILGITFNQPLDQTSVTTEDTAVLDDAESIGEVGLLGEHEVTDEVGPGSLSDSC